jgi:hypothetical protein
VSIVDSSLSDVCSHYTVVSLRNEDILHTILIGEAVLSGELYITVCNITMNYITVQYVKKLFETSKGNFPGSKPIIGKRITFNPEEIGAFGLEHFFHILHVYVKF